MISFHKIKDSLNQLIFVFGMPPRVRLTSNGYVKVKFPGRKSQLFKVSFLDSYRKRAFRNLRYVLENLGFKIIGEKTVRRPVDLNFNGAPLKVQVKDNVLVTSLAPTTELAKKYPALSRPAYVITFIYNGVGRFLMAFPYEEEEESEAFEEFFRKVIHPLYMKAFLYDSALMKEEKPDAKREENLPIRGEIEEGEGKTQEDDEEVKPQEKAETHKKVRKRVKKKQSESKRKAKKKRELSIEEVKEKISKYRPEDFRSKLAYERYLEALKEAPEREEDIHRLFYNLIVRKNDFKDFYLQLYSLAPKLIAHFYTS